MKVIVSLTQLPSTTQRFEIGAVSTFAALGEVLSRPDVKARYEAAEGTGKGLMISVFAKPEKEKAADTLKREQRMGERALGSAPTLELEGAA